MLNTKYFILPLQGGQTVPVENPYAYGNAWFVDKLTYVDNANQELDKIGQLALRHEAVADRKFREQLGDAVAQDTLSRVTLKSYEPNQLTYEVNSDKGGVIVFSEIYYPGWTATVDGQEQALGRVNYVLRALRVSPGSHEVVLSFFPKSIDRTETVAYAAAVRIPHCHRRTRLRNKIFCKENAFSKINASFVPRFSSIRSSFSIFFVPLQLIHAGLVPHRGKSWCGRHIGTGVLQRFVFQLDIDVPI